jgi:hypothetical protein
LVDPLQVNDCVFRELSFRAISIWREIVVQKRRLRKKVAVLCITRDLMVGGIVIGMMSACMFFDLD